METKVYSSFKIITLLLFIIFITLFFASYTGYYDYENKKQAQLTSEQIQKFELDVKNGVNLDLEDYIKKPSNGYQNVISSLGSRISKTISKSVSTTVDKTFDFLIKFVEQK